MSFLYIDHSVCILCKMPQFFLEIFLKAEKISIRIPSEEKCCILNNAKMTEIEYTTWGIHKLRRQARGSRG